MAWLSLQKGAATLTGDALGTISLWDMNTGDGAAVTSCHKPSFEIFMRDYYEPQLLPRILKCNAENNCDKEFKRIRDISKLNRVQPPVKIANVSMPDAEGYVNVTVEVGKGEDKYLVDGKESIRTTGVYDVRLFRDGQMVGSWPSDGAEKLLQRTAKNLESNQKSTDEQQFGEELRSWRGVTEVIPDDRVRIDQKTGVMILPPFRVKLARSKDVSEIDFSAYAFNEDRIKSQTAHWQWPDDAKAKLPRAQPFKPRAYVITVGVNAYENPDWNLKYAANDARQIQRTLLTKLSQGGDYQEVVPVSLISDYKDRSGQNVVTEKSATKANIRAVLDLLAGKQVDPEVLKSIPNADKLRKARPDDLIIISFSSHGYADNQGNFYFIPYDVGPGAKREITSDLLQHCISSEELSLWLRDVDAGRNGDDRRCLSLSGFGARRRIQAGTDGQPRPWSTLLRQRNPHSYLYPERRRGAGNRFHPTGIAYLCTDPRRHSRGRSRLQTA